MQILHICCVAPPKGGGMGVVADQEVRCLLKSGVQAWFACPKLAGREPAKYMIELPCFRLGNAAILRGLKQAVQDADVVHLHYPFYGAAEQIVRLKKAGLIKHLVMTLHMDAQADGCKGLIFDLHRKYIQPGLLRSADKLFISSYDYAENSSYKSVLEQMPEKVVELPFGVDTDCMCSGTPHREKFGISPGSFVIGTVSVQDRAHRFKGVDMLIKAMPRLPENIHLLLVGDGELQSKYRRLAGDLKVSDRVHFAGRLNQEDLLCAYRSMDVFAFPSTNGAEAFGLAMLEAMACGVPIVASRLPGVRVIAQDAGLLIPKADLDCLVQALRLMASDENLLNKYSSAARAKSVTFNWEKHAKALIEQYQQLCA